AVVGAGQGEDAKLLPDKVVLALRRQALTWLRADLADDARRAKGDPEQKAVVEQQLGLWLKDADLACVRDRQALDRLPEGERAAWRRLWDDVESLRREGSR